LRKAARAMRAVCSGTGWIGSVLSDMAGLRWGGPAAAYPPTPAQPTSPTVSGRLGDGGEMGDMLGYARVSTGDQDVTGQAMRLERAGAIKVFTDVRSGRPMDRPGLEALLAYARKGDTLTVVRLDRLGRSLAELLTTVAMLKERAIDLVSLEERIDTGSAAGELIFHVFGAIAHFERRLIAERTKDGIAAARAARQAARPPAARPGQDRGRPQAGGRRALPNGRGAAARPRQVDRLSGGQPRRHPARRVAGQHGASPSVPPSRCLANNQRYALL
jgi:DNA invertase Pin-like site-specific DNA recombinase